MGSSISSTVSDEKKDRIKEIIQEVVGLFMKNFPAAYKDALINRIKKEVVPAMESDKYLLTPPTPSYDLLTGMATKLGGSYKTWKLRHFIARNESENFRVDYFESEGGKKKGSIELCGYQPVMFTPEEAQEHGAEFGLKLVPHDDRRRTWYMRFTSSEERSAWNNVLTTGCFRAKPPLNADPLVATAFGVAFRAVRWNYGYYGWYSVSGTEVETLANFVSSILDREVMADIEDGIPAGPSKSANVALVRKTLDVSVMESVDAAWQQCIATSNSMAPPLESAVRDAVGVILEKEQTVKSSISSAINTNVNPYLADIGGRVCRPILDCITQPVTEAFCAATVGVRKMLLRELEAGAFRIDVLSGNINRCCREVNEWYTGPLEVANRVLYCMYSDGGLDGLSSLGPDGLTKYELYCMVLEKVRDLAHCAVYTFGEAVKVSDGSAAGLRSILTETSSQTLHDARIFEQELLVAVLGAVLQQPTAVTVTTPCAELVAPVQSMVDQLPGISDFFNVTAMLEDIVAEAVDGAAGAVVGSALSAADIARKFEEVSEEFGGSTGD